MISILSTISTSISSSSMTARSTANQKWFYGRQPQVPLECVPPARSLANPKSLYGSKPQALCECVIRNHEAIANDHSGVEVHSTGPDEVQGNGSER